MFHVKPSFDQGASVRNRCHLQDFDYFKRCVERFRNAARAPGRKLFVVSCIVDSPECLEELKGLGDAGTSARSVNLDKDEKDAKHLDANQRGDQCDKFVNKGCSWANFAPSEVSKLFESLQEFGVSDFKLAAAVLCVGTASLAEKEPLIFPIPLQKENSNGCGVSTMELGLDSAVMFEIHLSEAIGADIDPFKFFEESANDEAFTSTILQGCEVCPELETLKQDDYRPTGYRDSVVDPKTVKEKELVFECRCCMAGFPTRNKLYAHIRSSPSCLTFLEETDSAGFQSLMCKEVASQVFALMIGIHGSLTWTDFVESITATLQNVGDGVQLILHESSKCSHLGRSDFCCPAVAFTVLVKMSSALMGEALQCRLREQLASKTLVLHSCVLVGKSLALDWQQSSLQQHFAYLLPFRALHTSEEPMEFAKRQDMYRKFKHALNHVQKTWQTSEEPHPDDTQCLQLKMTQRLSFHQEFVLIKIAGEISSSVCLSLVAGSLALFHSYHWDASQMPESSIPCDLLYLEGQRFPQLERRHSPLFGKSCLPWGEDSMLARFRNELQDRLVLVDVDWPKVLASMEKQLILHGRSG